MSDNWKNQLYFSDNLDIMKELHRKHPEGFIDLIYIDPPFNSKRNYNVLFEDMELIETKAQKEAFADTWTNVSYMDTLNEISDLDISLFNFLRNLDNTNVSKGAISYLTTMAIRLWYMHRLLNNTGSFYLHCDPTMSHYLKILCDLIFGEKNFRNEITWKRFNFHADAKRYGTITDRILFYTSTENFVFNRQRKDYNEKYIESKFTFTESDGRRFRLDNLNPPGGRGPIYEFNGVTKAWRFTQDKMIELDKKGYIYKNSKVSQLKRYLDELPGQAVADIWDDISAINSQARERLGYPTQKPEALLERIINASSNEGDIVADFFCGCGTTISVAEKLKRRWLGVDISHLSVRLIAKRLVDSYGDDIVKTFEVHGFPKDLAGARELANNVKGGRLKFEDWIIEVLLHGIMNERRNEMGFDGYRTFSVYDKKYIVMLEVKSGNANPAQLHHFIKTVEDKKGHIGVFICFADEMTKNMHIIAKKEGQFSDEFGNTYCDKIQLISVEDLLDGKRPQIPQSKYETFKQAEKKSTDTDTQAKLEL